jgi:hypothetical protein
MATFSKDPGRAGSPLLPPPAVNATSPETPSNTLHCTCLNSKKKKHCFSQSPSVLIADHKRNQGTIKTTNIWSYAVAPQPKSILWSANWSLPNSEALVPKCKIDCSILIFIHDASTNKIKISLHIRHSFGSQHFPFHMWVPKFGAMLYAITIDRLHSAR